MTPSTPAPTTSRELRQARRAYLLVALWIPLAIAIAGVGLMLAWLPSMPQMTAVHWNAAGEPDGFAAAWLTPLLYALLGCGLPVLFAAFSLAGRRTGEWGPTFRFLGALSLATSAFLTVTTTVSYGAQRGLASGHDAPPILLALGVGFATAVVIGVVGWFAQPALTTSGGNVARAPQMLDIAAGERVVWLRSATMATPGLVAIVGSAVLLAVLAIGFALTGIAIWWVMALVAVVVAGLATTSCVFRVRVDGSGLRVSSAVGLPRFDVPLDEVASVAVVTVHPMSEFGGWGIRTGLDGRTGVVLRAGDAIQVARRNGRIFVVTVDDAETGAAVLRTLAARARQTA